MKKNLFIDIAGKNIKGMRIIFGECITLSFVNGKTLSCPCKLTDNGYKKT